MEFQLYVCYNCCCIRLLSTCNNFDLQHLRPLLFGCFTINFMHFAKILYACYVCVCTYISIVDVVCMRYRCLHFKLIPYIIHMDIHTGINSLCTWFDIQKQWSWPMPINKVTTPIHQYNGNFVFVGAVYKYCCYIR